MIEIIPNWHPLLVHFTVGLLSTSSLFYIGSAFLSHTNSWKQQWLNMANWSLWSGCLFAIGTAFAGWLAYNSVAHDSASHAAMTLHRNWALPTASTFLLLGLWAILNARKNRRPGFLFLTFSIIAAGLLMVTGWLGAEAVYRYGLGVKSLPVVAEGADGHNHSHGSEHDESTMDEAEHQQGTTNIEQPLTGDGHQHSHVNKEIATETDPSKPSVEESADGHNHSHGSEHDESTMDEAEHQHGMTNIEQPLAVDGHQHSHVNKEIPTETKPSNPSAEESADGHNHSHISENNESSKVDYQGTTTEIEQVLEEKTHPHNHETLPAKEQLLKQHGDGHQHEHKSKNTLSKIKRTIEPSIESHDHDSNSLEPITTPLDQDNTSKDTSLSSPTELHSLYPTEAQNEEAVNEISHSHDAAHEH